jgi:hypothetical protein
MQRGIRQKQFILWSSNEMWSRNDKQQLGLDVTSLLPSPHPAKVTRAGKARATRRPQRRLIVHRSFFLSDTTP